MAKGKNNYQEYNGVKFKNETEVEFYQLCELAVKDGRIKSFEYNVMYELFPSFFDWRGKSMTAITHSPDFILTLNDDSKLVIDTKGGGAEIHDEVSVVKRKIWMYYNQNIPYYMISKTVKYLGDEWVESSKRNDFHTKIKTKYKKIYPNENTRKYSTCATFVREDWNNYFEVENILGLFYTYTKEYTKKELLKMVKK